MSRGKTENRWAHKEISRGKTSKREAYKGNKLEREQILE